MRKMRENKQSIMRSTLLLTTLLLASLIFASFAEGAIYITRTDNLNNAGEPVPDHDMGSSTCVFNDNPIHPIEFNINLNGALPTRNAYLSLFILDVDWPYEVDEIYFNDHLLGYAIGESDLNYSSFFVIPDISWIRQGNNTVKVLVDRNNIGNWCADVVNGQLMIDEGTGSGTASIRTATLDKPSYALGQQGTVNLEVDTTLTTQTVRIEIILKDPSGNNISFDTNSAGKNWVIRSNSDEPYSWSFTIPSSGQEGIWTVYIAVYDVSSGLFQSYRSLSFQIGTVNPLPTLTSITPNSGTFGTGTAVTIKGSNFIAGSTTCNVGGQGLSNLLVIDSNTITGNVAPQLAVGTHSLLCSTSYGSTQLPNAFTVLASIPQITVSPASHDYGQVPIGATIPKTFSVTNSSISNVIVYDIGVSNVITPQPSNAVSPDPSYGKRVVNDRNEIIFVQHSVDSKVSYMGAISQSASTTAATVEFVKSTDNCSGRSLSAGQNCTFSIDFAPKTAGQKTGEVSIFYNHPSSPYYAVRLTGNGISATSNYAFIANSGSNSVSVVDFVNGKELVKVGVGSKPMAVAAVPSLKKFYVTDYLSHTVTVVSGNTANKKPIPVGANPLGIAANSSGTRVYVGNYTDNTITEIDTATDTAIRYHDLRGWAYGITGIAVSPDGYTIYAASYANSIVIAIDVVTGNRSFVIVDRGPYGITLHPNGNYLYTANYADGTVSVVSISGTQMQFVGNVNIGGAPVSLAPTPSGSLIYVADYNSAALKYFSPSTLVVTVVPDSNINMPFGVAFDNESGSLLIVQRGSNKLYNASKGTLINVGSSPTSFGNSFLGPISVITPQPLSSEVGNIDSYQNIMGNIQTYTPAYDYSHTSPPPHE